MSYFYIGIKNILDLF